MKLYQALLPLAAAMALAGCQGRGTAEGVIGQAEGVISQVKDQAAVSAPNELKQAEATLAHMKQNYEEREYQAVIDEVPQFNAQIEAMKTTATANNAAAAEWNSLNTEVPKVIENPNSTHSTPTIATEPNVIIIMLVELLTDTMPP